MAESIQNLRLLHALWVGRRLPRFSTMDQSLSREIFQVLATSRPAASRSSNPMERFGKRILFRGARAHIVAALEDGGLLVMEGEENVYRGFESDSEQLPAEPILYRVLPDGSSYDLPLGLQVGESWNIADSWFDAEGRLVVFGRRFDGDSYRSEFLRDDHGNVGLPIPILGASGETTVLGAVCRPRDGVGAWGVDYPSDAPCLVRLNDDGEIVHVLNLDPAGIGGWRAYIEDIAETEQGVLVGGDFQKFNGVGANGLALMRADGTVESGWGGWLRRYLQLPELTFCQMVESTCLDVC